MSAPALVLDASVTMAWAFKDEKTIYTSQVLKSLDVGKAYVPSIWSLEVCNTLLVAERHGRLSQTDSLQFLSFLWQLPIEAEIMPSDRLAGESFVILALARMHQLSVYDASYLHLAMQLGCPLATMDNALHKAALEAGVPLFGESRVRNEN